MAHLVRKVVDHKEQHQIIVIHMGKKQKSLREEQSGTNKKQSKKLRNNLNLKGTHSNKPQKFSPNLKMNRRNLQTRGR